MESILQPVMRPKLITKDRAPSLRALSDFSVEDEVDCTGSVRLENNAVHKSLPLGCDACQYCEDICEDVTCTECSGKSLAKSKETSPQWPPCQSTRSVQSYTRCQVRRHNHEGSAWIIAGNNIYDVTESMHHHPGGTECLLRRAGGARDCTTDFEFHSQRAMKQVKRLFIGKLRSCPCEVSSSQPRNKDWWVFW